MLNFSESDIQYAVDPVLWKEVNLKSKRRGKLSIHFCGADDAAEVVLRTIVSVNQLSVYGAATGMCDELAWRIFPEKYRETCRSEQFGDHCDANRNVDNERIL